MFLIHVKEPLTGCGKSRFIGPNLGYNPQRVTRCGGTSDARLGCTKRRAVQLRELRSAGSKGSPVAGNPADCGRGTGSAVARIRGAVRQVWSAVDPARALASRPAVAGLLFGAFREATDGAAPIQSGARRPSLLSRFIIENIFYSGLAALQNR